MLNSNHKGNIAEVAIMLAAVRLGVPVLRPVTEHGRCDLAFDVGSRLWRVQCKWGRVSTAKDVVMVSTSGSWLSPAGYIRSTYTEHEVDLFGVYCGELERCFLIPAKRVVGKTEIRLRLRPALNGQRGCINLAADFDFDGAIAQLGERRRGTAEVAGSSPASSTRKRPSRAEPLSVGTDELRDHLGYWIDRIASGEEAIVTRRGKPRIRLTPLGNGSLATAPAQLAL